MPDKQSEQFVNENAKNLMSRVRTDSSLKLYNRCKQWHRRHRRHRLQWSHNPSVRSVGSVCASLLLFSVLLHSGSPSTHLLLPFVYLSVRGVGWKPVPPVRHCGTTSITTLTTMLNNSALLPHHCPQPFIRSFECFFRVK